MAWQLNTPGNRCRAMTLSAILLIIYAPLSHLTLTRRGLSSLGSIIILRMIVQHSLAIVFKLVAPRRRYRWGELCVPATLTPTKP